jgi:hypothetical protein
MSKSGKSKYFRHVFANNFFGIFFKTFSTDLTQREILLFFDTQIEFLKKNFFLLLLLAFFFTLNANAHERAQKNGKTPVS